MAKERLGWGEGVNRDGRGVEQKKLFGSVDSMRGAINKKVLAVLASVGLLGAIGGSVWLYNEVPKAEEAVKEQISKELTELIKRNVDVFKVMLTFLEQYVKVFGKSALDKVFNGDVVGFIGQLQQGIDGAKSVYDGLVTDVNELVECYQNLQDAELPVLKMSLQRCTNPGQLIVGLGKLPGIADNPQLLNKYKDLVRTNTALQRAINEKLSDDYAQKLFWEYLFGSNTKDGSDTDTSWMNNQQNDPNMKPPVTVDVNPTEPKPVRIQNKALPETPEIPKPPKVPEAPAGYGSGNNN